MNTAERTQQQRVRRMAERQGLDLVISRRRDPRALDYGAHYLVKAGGEHWRSREQVAEFRGLDEVEAWLDTPRDQR